MKLIKYKSEVNMLKDSYDRFTRYYQLTRKFCPTHSVRVESSLYYALIKYLNI